MTYFHVKPSFSHGMSLVIGQVPHPYRPSASAGRIHVHYASAFTNHLTFTPDSWKELSRQVWCCQLSPVVYVCVQERRAKQQFISFVLNHCIQWSALYSRCFSEKDIGGYLEHTMPLEAADAMICPAGQASPWFVWCWSLVWNSLFGFFWRLWLTYAWCQMMHIWQ